MCPLSWQGSGPGRGCTWQRGSSGWGSRERGRPWAASDSRPHSALPSWRRGWEEGTGGFAGARISGKDSLPGRPGAPLSLSVPGDHVTFLLGVTLRPAAERAPWCSLCTDNAPAHPGRFRACSQASLPSACAPSSSAPLALPPRSQFPPSLASLAVAVPPYLCPRSGRLLVPRPQSPFDPLLGSEPCDPVGGPRSQAASAARLSCWVSPPLPLFPPASRRWQGALRCAAPCSPGGRAGRERRLPGDPPGPSPRDSARPGEGRRELGLHAGPRFSAAESKKRALCGHSYLFVNIWPAN